MNVSIDVPFQIGQKLWSPSYTSQQVTVKCPACFGKRVVTIIYGDNEHVIVDCDACIRGCENPTGYIQNYNLVPKAQPFIIKQIESMFDNIWTFKSEDGVSAPSNELYETENEALEIAQKRATENYEQNMRSRLSKRARTKKGSWTITYHRQCIKDLEIQLAWHQT